MTFRDRTQYHWRIAFVVWLFILTIATHVPQGEASEATFESPDKLLHMVSFGILAFLWMCSQWFHHFWSVWVSVALWAVLDEVVQNALPIQRPFSIEDVVAGQFGIAAALVWMHAMQGHAAKHIRDEVDRLLANPRQWFVLCSIAIVTSLLIALLVWLVMSGSSGTQRSGFALFVGVLIGASCVVVYVIRVCHFESKQVHVKKGAAIPLILTMLVTAMLVATVSFSSFDPWVVALTSLSIGCRMTWSRMINRQTGSQSS